LERTLVLIKPDGVERKLIGEIISFYERRGLNIEALSLIKPTKSLAEAHYEEHRDKLFYTKLIDYLTEGLVCAMVLSGENAVELVRKINGDKDPLIAENGSIRGTYGCDKTRNLVHASDSTLSANREIKLWFPQNNN